MKQLLILLAALTVVTGITLRLYLGERQRGAQQTRNTRALLEDLKRWKTRDSLSAVRTYALELSTEEIRRYANEQADLAERLQLRLNEVDRIAHTELEVNVELEGRMEIREDSLWHYVSPPSPHLEFEQTLNPASQEFAATIRIPVTLTSFVVPEYRHRFLWWKWKLIGIQGITTTDNPHVEITGHRYIIRR